MKVPKPKSPLGTHCSAIRNNTLYTYSEDAFQSLELRNGSSWKTLKHGVPARGAACVIAHKGTDAESLYVIGGATTDPESTPEKGFWGLQRWKFAGKSWESLVLSEDVTFNLTGHGASFLEETSRLIVFAGTRYPSVGLASANTFLIQTDGEHEIISVPAPRPLLAPVVLPYDQGSALIVGGDTTNTVLTQYKAATGWADMDAHLDVGLPRRGQAWASIMDGDDGSKMLITYDLSKSPAEVATKTLKEADNQNRKRQDKGASPGLSTDNQLTVANWPTYNSTLAPKGTREGTSLAYEGDMVVFSGGNADEPLLMFNTRKNTWVSAQSVLAQEPLTRTDDDDDDDDRDNRRLDPVESNVASPSTTSSPSSSATALGTGKVMTGGLNTIQLLFIVLGSILATALMLALCFYFLRKRRRAQTGNFGEEDAKKDGKDRMSFQDRGLSYLKETGEVLTGPKKTYMNDNNSWLNVQRQASTKERNNFKNGPTVHRIGGQGIIVHPGQEVQLGRVNSSSTNLKEGRGSGWSRYFSGNSATNLVSDQPRAYSGAQSSVYTESSSMHQNPYLHNAGSGVAAGGMGVVSVQRAGSNGLILDAPRGHERRGSDISLTSMGSYSSGIPESVTEKPLWSNLDTDRDQTSRGNIPSSVYPSSRDERRDTEWTNYSGPPNRGTSHYEGVDNLSWLNLRNQ